MGFVQECNPVSIEHLLNRRVVFERVDDLAHRLRSRFQQAVDVREIAAQACEKFKMLRSCPKSVSVCRIPIRLLVARHCVVSKN
jgi:hypothetical protein